MHASLLGRLSIPFAAATLILFLFSSSHAFAVNPNVDRLVTFGGSLSDTGNAFVWLSDTANASCGTTQNVPPYETDNVRPFPVGLLR